MSWPLVALSDVVEVMHQGINTAADKVVYAESGIPIIQSKHLKANSLDFNGVKFLSKTDVGKYKHKYVPKENDILFANIGTIGKSVIVRDESEFMFAWNVFVIRLKHELIDVSFLKHFFDRLVSINYYDRFLTGGTVKFVNKKVMGGIEIPLPPLKEQKRIAAILDKADAIRRKRQRAIQLADDFLRSVFLDMFGDPVSNPKGYKTSPLGVLVKVVSGATPSKSNELYWRGTFPWVSPKDMKVIKLSDAIDHISEDVFNQTNLKKLPIGSILIVVRGMILAHTVPVAIAAREVAINQDIKAFICGETILPEYLLWFLKSQHENLLAKVSTAAHGTKRFDMQDILTLEVFLPRIVEQEKFISICNKYSKADLSFSKNMALCAGLFKSLSQKAFSGKL